MSEIVGLSRQNGDRVSRSFRRPNQSSRFLIRSAKEPESLRKKKTLKNITTLWVSSSSPLQCRTTVSQRDAV